MGRKDTVKMLKEDLVSYAWLVKLFNNSSDWYIARNKNQVEQRIMYFEEGKMGKQYKVTGSIDLEEIYQEIQLVFDHKKTMIGKRQKRGMPLKFTGKGDVYKEIFDRLEYNQKLKINAKEHRLT